jgi:hypothetical protein
MSDDIAALVCQGLCFVFGMALTVGLAIWAYNDAKRHGQNVALALFLVLFLGIPGIIIWLIIRNTTPAMPVDQPAWVPQKDTAHDWGSTTYSESWQRVTCRQCWESNPKSAKVCKHCGAKLW